MWVSLISTLAERSMSILRHSKNTTNSEQKSSIIEKCHERRAEHALILMNALQKIVDMRWSCSFSSLLPMGHFVLNTSCSARMRFKSYHILTTYQILISVVITYLSTPYIYLHSSRLHMFSECTVSFLGSLSSEMELLGCRVRNVACSGLVIFLLLLFLGPCISTRLITVSEGVFRQSSVSICTLLKIFLD